MGVVRGFNKTIAGIGAYGGGFMGMIITIIRDGGNWG
jgi:hypothetical protein